VAAGHTVYGAARRAEVLARLASELGASFVPVVVDVTDREAVRRACASLPAVPDVVILNAGVGENETRKAFDIAIHERTFAVNYFGALNFVDALMPAFMARGSGKFVAISSLAAYRGLPKGGAYGASKAAITTAFESCRNTYRETGVRFVTVHPGFVDTPMQKGVKMPLMWPVRKAAARILRGIRCGCSDITFPLAVRVILAAGRLMPNWLFDRTIARA
jgi:NADP-dependent 3-hydroxy acid dehydrogenase YdfG